LSAGGSTARLTPASFSTPWSKRFMTAGPCPAAGSSITAIAACNTYQSNTPSASPRPALNPPSAASATATTMPWPKPSTVSTRPRSSTAAALGVLWKPSSTPRSNGWTGSTTGGFSRRSATSRPPRPKPPTMPTWRNSLSQRDSNQIASGVTGAVQAAQMGAIGLLEERAPRQLHDVYKELVSPDVFKRMDESYQRVSKVIHSESKTSGKLERRQAWTILHDIRRSVYALELLELSDAEKLKLQNQAKKLERLAVIEGLVEQAHDLDGQDRAKLKELVSEIKRGASLSEDQQKTLTAVLRKIGGKAWEVARPILSDVLTAAIEKASGLE